MARNTAASGPARPKTSGMVERFNRRISSGVLSIHICCHRAMERVLRGSIAAYNAWCHRVLQGRKRP